MERNEELQAALPPFHSSSEISIVYLHHRTDLPTIEQLIEKAKETTLYAIDTESEGRKENGKESLIQIQCVHSRNQSTVLVIETQYLPDRQSLLFMRMKELLAIILKDENKVLCWAEIDVELGKFQQYELLMTTTPKGEKNMQLEFGRWHNELGTRPKKPTTQEDEPMNIWDTILGLNSPEEASTRTSCECGHRSHQNAQATWSLQDAIALVFGEFLDKSETINKWGCGLDPKLNTWKRKTFSRRQYREEEERTRRQKMKDYAVNDCTAVTRLFFHVFPTETITVSAFETPPLTSSGQSNMNMEGISDISEDEQIWPKPQRLKRNSAFEERATTEAVADLNMFLGYSTEEMRQIYLLQEQAATEFEGLCLFSGAPADQLNADHLPPPQESQEISPPAAGRPSKTERQRRKNEKLRWKRKIREDFQHHVLRPIYPQYDYRKIRSQLLDDGIQTSHQLTINRRTSEVRIRFKTAEERQRAAQIIRINYFSRRQFKVRWC